MTADPSTPAAGRERLQKLAQLGASQRHYFDESASHFDAGIAPGRFDTCEHPDCVLVRSALPASVEGSLEAAARKIATEFQGWGGHSRTYRISVRLLHALVEALSNPAASAEGREREEPDFESMAKELFDEDISSEGIEMMLRRLWFQAQASTRAEGREQARLSEKDIAIVADLMDRYQMNDAFVKKVLTALQLPPVTLAKQWREHADVLAEIYPQSERASVRAETFRQAAQELEAAVSPPALQEAGAAPASGLVVDRDAEMLRELRAYLDTQFIDGDNIGSIRRGLFVPWESQWNGWVREETAAREKSLREESVMVVAGKPNELDDMFLSFRTRRACVHTVEGAGLCSPCILRLFDAAHLISPPMIDPPFAPLVSPQGEE